MKGKVFNGRYEIEEKIGSGGMAEVYRAHDNTLNRTVAVKILYPQYASEEGFVTRFRREAQAVANLNHPNIVNIYDWGSEDSTYYIVMEYLVGQNLKEIIQEKAPLDDRLIIDIGRQVAAALSSAHRHDLIHRDIKPQNIIITNDGEVKVTDFGIARSTTSTMTQSGSIMGTAHYLSPEQAQGGETTAASDLYSLGVTLFEMATGKVPFEGESPVTIALKHIHEAPISPRRLNPDMSPSLQAVILKALSKNPVDRYQSSEELREDLGRCASGLPVAPVSPGGESTIVIPKIDGAAPRNETPARRQSRRPRWLIPLIIAAVLLLGSVAAALIYMNSTTTKTPDIISLTESRAKKVLAKKDLKLKVSKRVFSAKIDPGHIISQEPRSKESIRVGSFVSVIVSRGKERVKMPRLTGISIDQATFFLAKSDLNVGDITREYSDEIDADEVISQEPAAGARVYKGTSVNLTVSKGAKPIRVPDLIGKDVTEATALLNQEHLSIVKNEEFHDSVAAGKVIRQSPPAGTVVEKNGTVTIVVSKGPEMADVPNVMGLSQSEAKNKLENLGLVVQIKTGISGPENYGKVVTQSPDSGQRVVKGSTVTIWVGQAPP